MEADPIGQMFEKAAVDIQSLHIPPPPQPFVVQYFDEINSTTQPKTSWRPPEPIDDIPRDCYGVDLRNIILLRGSQRVLRKLSAKRRYERRMARIRARS